MAPTILLEKFDEWAGGGLHSLWKLNIEIQWDPFISRRGGSIWESRNHGPSQMVVSPIASNFAEKFLT